MEENHTHRLNIATGHSRFERRWRGEALTWGELRERLSTPVVTAETAAEYRRMPPQRQTEVKDVGGFVGGALTDGLRKAGSVFSRSVVTLDYDEFSEPRLRELREAMRRLGGPAWLLHSTHKHTAAQWRVRVAVPLARDVTPDEYGAVARKVASEIGFGGIDRSTFEPSRLMFWPSRSSDGDWLCEEGEGPLLDPDAVLASYADWRDMSRWPLLPEEDLGGLFGDRPGEPPVVRRGCAPGQGGGKPQEDPRSKKGLVGVFCRAYDVEEAIARFLPNVYTRCGGRRWTHVGSTTAGGAWVLDGGRFLYSFHATDPLQGLLLNSWDLVRLALFGEGGGDDPKASGRKMEELAMADPRVKTLLMDERRAQALADFAAVPDGSDRSDQSDPSDPSDKSDPYDEWDRLSGAAFKVKKDGTVVTDANSLSLVLEKHPDIAGRLRLDTFAGNIRVEGELPWPHEGQWWGNGDDTSLRVWLNRKFGMTGASMIADVVNDHAKAHRFHPVREYLGSLEWDSTPRCATVLTHVLGAEDTELNRFMTELFFRAAVMRVWQPGIKYDNMLTLQGPEGSGKSSFFSILGGEWFSDTALMLDSKDAMASLQGVWIQEMSELVGVRKKESDTVKNFLSRQQDKFRPAYGQRDDWRPRQTVFGGTTNEEYFLKGIDNSNRRFMVVRIKPELRKVAEPPRVWLERWRDQLWAEAVVLARNDGRLFLPPEMEGQARKNRKEFNLDLANPLFPEIDRFLDLELPPGWETMSTAERVEWLGRGRGDDGGGMVEGLDYIVRGSVTVPEILQELFGMRKTDRDYASRGREVGRYLNTLKGWEFVGTRKNKLYGKQKTWKRIESIESTQDPFANL